MEKQEIPLRDKFFKFIRRNYGRIIFYALVFLATAYAFFVEPRQIEIRNVNIRNGSGCRIVLFSDLHYKGDGRYLQEVIDKINMLKPDIICFCGDIVEDSGYLREALGYIRQLRYPAYGVPGNHEYWSGSSIPEITEAFKATGGDFLVDRSVLVGGRKLFVTGYVNSPPFASETGPGTKRLLLTHYPMYAEDVKDAKYDLILAGHSHGGQCRIPFFGAVTVPYKVGKYQKGLYDVAGTPLYVSPGIGTFFIPARFLCRPEITVITF